MQVCLQPDDIEGINLLYPVCNGHAMVVDTADAWSCNKSYPRIGYVRILVTVIIATGSVMVEHTSTRVGSDGGTPSCLKTSYSLACTYVGVRLRACAPHLLAAAPALLVPPTPQHAHAAGAAACHDAGNVSRSKWVSHCVKPVHMMLLDLTLT